MSEISLGTIGKRLRNLRKSKGLSQTQLADLLGYKQPASVSSIEADKSPLDTNALIKIAETFQADLHWLITGELSPAATKIHNALKPYLMAHLNDVVAKVQKLEVERMDLTVQEKTPQVESRLEEIQDESYRQQLYFKKAWEAVTDSLKEYGIESPIEINLVPNEDSK